MLNLLIVTTRAAKVAWFQ